MTMKEMKEISPQDKPKRGPLRSFLRIIKIAVISLVVTAVALEVIIRVFDPLGVSHFSDMPRYFSELCEIVGPPRIIRHRGEKTVSFRHFSITTNPFKSFCGLSQTIIEKVLLTF